MTKKSQVQSLSGLTFFRAYPSYTRYWIANTISRMGDSIDSIAVIWMVLELTGSNNNGQQAPSKRGDNRRIFAF